MNGIRFYLEFTDKSKHKPGGTVVAALVLNGSYGSRGTICYEAIAAVFDWPNSPVAGTGVACDYLRQKCKRIWMGSRQHRTRRIALSIRMLPVRERQDLPPSTGNRRRLA